MEILKAALLAIVQGLTEFLPVSSSGHLVIFEDLLRVKRPGLILEVALHLGTVCAIMAVYCREIWALIRDSIRALRERSLKGNPNAKFVVALIVATIPTAFMGVGLKTYIAQMFENLLVVGVALIVTALVLWLTRSAKEAEASEVGLLRAILIGIAQGVAMVPGISRSGTTISCGLLLGIDRESTARFSFLLSIPAILGATALALRDAPMQIDWLPIVVGTAISFIVGYLALRVLLRFVKRGRLHVFSYYCLPLGALTLLASVVGR